MPNGIHLLHPARRDNDYNDVNLVYDDNYLADYHNHFNDYDLNHDQASLGMLAGFRLRSRAMLPSHVMREQSKST